MGAERGSRVSQLALSPCCPRVRATENAPRVVRWSVLERRHSLVEIVQRGVGVFVERPCVITPHCERAIIILSENASCHGHRFANKSSSKRQLFLADTQGRQVDIVCGFEAVL